MLVSWNWLRDYLDLDMPPEAAVERLMMAGLNHESTQHTADDIVIDLEITSNRVDCLGQIGIAREIAVLYGKPLKLADPRPKEGATPVSELAEVKIEAPELCPRYIARVIRGIKGARTPAWMVKRLSAVGMPAIDNVVVDITNYVLMECGQPLHAFDLAKLRGQRDASGNAIPSFLAQPAAIIVRAAKKGEKIEAIDHRTYELPASACVIADRDRPVAVAGVMGGAETEVSPSTKDVLIEAATFAQLSVRTTARALSLHSPSSYRFERGVDWEGIDWASRRACQLILELAGGELAAGSIDVIAAPPAARPPIVFRFSQLPRILGIEVDSATVRRILEALGCTVEAQSAAELKLAPPSWRRDLDREIDLVEEVARVHGYDKIPEDARVPMAPSHKSDRDRVVSLVRQTLAAGGFREAMTISFVDEAADAAFSPWTDAEPLRAATAMLRGADRLRRSIVPSLLASRKTNEALANPRIELFEVARAYLPQGEGLPQELHLVTLTSGGDCLALKGVVESVVAALDHSAGVTVERWSHELFEPGRAAKLMLGGEHLGYLGELSAAGRKKMELRGPASIAELRIDVLEKVAKLIPQYQPASEYPAITGDINLVVAERVRWADLSATARRAAGTVLEQLDYRETFRDPKKDGPGKKRLLFSYLLRSRERTLTSDEAKQVWQSIVTACQSEHGAAVLGA